MWNGLQLEDALAWLQAQVDSVRSLHPDRSVILGETGWATSVHTEGEQARLIKGRPGEAEQKRFYEQVGAWADGKRFPVFWFEAFDENWKGGTHPNEVEKHWGLFRADRTPKAAMSGGTAE
jgi:exo-beta-1,3-glucanase (GH17 family)